MKDRLARLLSEAEGLVNNDLPTVEQIADYLIEHGVIVPPCKVGDTVYSCIGRPYKVEKITIKRDQDHMTIVLDSALSGQLIVYETDFGQIVFLTREEAEKSTCGKERGMIWEENIF